LKNAELLILKNKIVEEHDLIVKALGILEAFQKNLIDWKMKC